jgi:ABC-type transporter Mla MlaB component
MYVLFDPEKETLDLFFDGNLDHSNTKDVNGIIRIIPQIQERLKTCIVDLTLIERVFDAGIALLHRLIRQLRQVGATVVVLGDHPDLQYPMSLIQCDATYPSRQVLAATCDSAESYS